MIYTENKEREQLKKKRARFKKMDAWLRVDCFMYKIWKDDGNGRKREK